MTAASLFRVVVCAVLGFAVAGRAMLAQVSPRTARSAQNSAAAPAASATKAFEVASVRKSPPPDYQKMIQELRQGRRPDSSRIDGSRATYTYMSLKQLIAYAYKLRIYEVSGPEWLSTDRMDIAAKLQDGATKDDAPEMMRTLLEERFKLAAHKETKDAPVLGLTVAKGGAKLTESTAPVETIDANAELQPGQSRMDSVDGPVLLVRNPDGSTTYHMGPRGTFTLKFDMDTRSMHMTAAGMSMRGLALMMTSLGGGEGRQVVDMTGLTGRYDVAAEFSMMDLMQSLKDQGIELPQRPADGPDSTASDPGGGATLASALNKMGLRMDKSHAEVERLVVDHVEADPTEQ